MEVVRNIFFVCLLLRIVEYSMPGNNYSQYIKFYGGIVIIVLILNPVVSFLLSGISVDKIINDYINSSRINNIKNELNSNQEKTIERIVKPYAEEITRHVKRTVEDNNLELENCLVEFYTDSKNNNYGEIKIIKTIVKNKYSSTQELSDSMKITIANITKQICDFYNLKKENIYVNIK